MKELVQVMSSRSATVETPADTQILIKREFDAPKELVYKAYTTPELVRRWWTAGRGDMTICDIDLRVGGDWRYVMEAEGFGEVAFHGTYREVVPNERLVSTEVFEGMPDAEALDTLTLTEDNGRTFLTLVVEHKTKEYRDGHLESGMEDGLQDAYDRLEQVAVELSQRV
jgi:uncharacterized protein YndB with AHSA1/START domain